MKGTRKGTRLEVAFGLSVFSFLCCAVLFSGGCVEGLGSSGADREVPVAEKGEAELLAALDRKFENPDAHFELGRFYHRQQQWVKAEYHYNIALGFDPAHRLTQAAMVKMLSERSDTAKAENYASSYIRQASASVQESLKLGLEFEALGFGDYALRCYSQALNAAPDSAAANKRLGFYYLNKGEDAQAKRYLSRSFELEPNQADVAGALGRLGVVVQLPHDPDKELRQ